jgi:hypothetical protein
MVLEWARVGLDVGHDRVDLERPAVGVAAATTPAAPTPSTGPTGRVTAPSTRWGPLAADPVTIVEGRNLRAGFDVEWGRLTEAAGGMASRTASRMIEEELADLDRLEGGHH